VDSDELWSPEQVMRVRNLFLSEPDRSAAWFWCRYYVGPDRAISTRYNYAQNPNQEWLRVWRFEPGMVWDKHEPPVLVGFDSERRSFDVGRRNPFWQGDTEKAGAVFDHFAYATEAQARFKESYYGYAGAVAQWRALQQAPRTSCHLRDYFAWVTDETMVDVVERLNWTPSAVIDPGDGEWRLGEALVRRDHARRPRIAVDGLFFQIAKSGIARLWANLLEAWVQSGFADQVVVLDREGTAPHIDGVIYRSIPRHNLVDIEDDAEMLQAVCDLEGIDLFISTYYTAPTRTPSIFYAYDMIPELIGDEGEDPWWRQKRIAIQHAAGYVAISESTANDLARLFPGVERSAIQIAYCAIDAAFHPCSDEEVAKFRAKHGLTRDYILLVGERSGWGGYKNGLIVAAALAVLDRSARPLLVCIGGAKEIEADIKSLLPDGESVRLTLADDELRLAYGAAHAFVCPSFLEGFGLPIGEAMAVGCPVLTCRTSSIPEVAGDAAIYFDPLSPSSLAEAIGEIAKPDIRADQIARGFDQLKKFDQARSAREVAEYCERVWRAQAEATPSRRTLEEVYAVQAQLRRSNAKLDVAQAALLQAKVELSEMHHTLKQQLPGTAAFADSSQTDVIFGLEKRLADAHAALLQPDAFAAVTILNDLPSSEYGTASKGLGELEGPYPQLDIHRPLRWQTEPKSLLCLMSSAAGAAVLNLEIGVIAEDVELEVFWNDESLGRYRAGAPGWSFTHQLLHAVTAVRGGNALEIRASPPTVTDGRSLYIAIFQAELRSVEDPPVSSDTTEIIPLTPLWAEAS
jgi:glycosyltransferase involved in cell wall biosynthesis